MPKRATDWLDPDGLCSECGQVHHDRWGKISCAGHVRFNRDPESPDYRARLPEPRPCQHPPRPGLTRCYQHGAGKKAAAIGRRREAEKKVAAMARKLIPDADDRDPITNPLERLLELASEADAFRESLRLLANDLGGRIRYAGDAGGEQLRAEVATYRAAMRDVTDLLIAVARLDIEGMLARVTVAQAEQSMAALKAGMDAAGLDDDTKRSVMANAARHLRAVPPVAS